MIVNEWNQNSILKSMESTVLFHTEMMQDHAWCGCEEGQ